MPPARPTAPYRDSGLVLWPYAAAGGTYRQRPLCSTADARPRALTPPGSAGSTRAQPERAARAAAAPSPCPLLVGRITGARAGRCGARASGSGCWGSRERETCDTRADFPRGGQVSRADYPRTRDQCPSTPHGLVATFATVSPTCEASNHAAFRRFRHRLAANRGRRVRGPDRRKCTGSA